jgi:regulator of nonsense transcripts 2
MVSMKRGDYKNWLTQALGGPPVPGRINPFDMPDDFFRIRLVATLLETCGIFFNRGVAGKKLDYFLSFFQYYIYTKDPLPMDIEFIVQDVFALTRPQWKLASNLEEASRAFQLAMAQDQKTAGIDKAVEPEDVDSDGLSEDGMGMGDAEVGGGDVEPEEESESESEVDVSHFKNRTLSDLLTSKQAESIGDGVPSATGTDSEEESIVVTRQEEEVNPEDEADFEREYAKMMAESLESRKHERKATFDVPLPMRRKEATTSSEPWADESATPSTAPSGTMAFSLLTKRGNRQQVSFRISNFTVSLLTLSLLDTNCGLTLQFHIRYCDENTTSCRTGGTAADQESGPELRPARWRRSRW